MNRRRGVATRFALMALFMTSGLAAQAQTSSNFKLSEWTFNQGGRPLNGITASSAGYRLSLESIGDGAARVGLAGPAYRLDSAFVAAYPPPNEATGLRFLDLDTLRWDSERSVGSYALYRGPISTLPGGYGLCLASPLTTTEADDALKPSAGSGFFYLVTARNRLHEEGTKGFATNGLARANPSPCP